VTVQTNITTLECWGDQNEAGFYRDMATFGGHADDKASHLGEVIECNILDILFFHMYLNNIICLIIIEKKFLL
jgi:hypothetical protein